MWITSGAGGLPFWQTLYVVVGGIGDSGTGIREPAHGPAKENPQMAQMTQMGGDRNENTASRKRPTGGLT